jgi:hypothetical protein
MRGSWIKIGLGVILGPLVFISDEKTDWSTEGDSMFSTRLKLY